MEARKSKFVVKVLPSLTDFAFLMPLLFLFFRMDGGKSLLGDADVGWHIRTGDWILANHRAPMRDLFSFSKPGQAWYAWEWLTDVLWSWLHAKGGLAALVLFSSLLLAFTFAMVFRLARRKANPVAALAVTMVAAAASSLHWLARPHLFTMLFAVIFYMLLERVRAGRGRLSGMRGLILLPAATILWTNLHGGFFVGILMVGTYAAGEALRAALSGDPGERRTAWRAARGYAWCAAACLAASLVNPYGYRLHQHVFQYLRDPFERQYIVEFLSLNFHHPAAIFFEILLLLGIAAAFWNVSRRSFIEPLLILFWAHVALLAARNIPLFAIVVAPPLAEAIAHWLDWLPRSDAAGWLRAASGRVNALTAELADTDSIPRWHVVSALGFLALAALLFAPHPPAKFRSEFDPGAFPAAAVDALRADATARIFAYDQWGDYLIYRLYPRTRVLIDGRSDFYGAEFEKKVLSVENVKFDWQRTLNEFGIDTILLSPSAPLCGALKESSRWRLVYDDGVALVFRPVRRAAGQTESAAGANGGTGRDREVTKLEARGLKITQNNHSTT
ncbi:MAG: hypothetical protein ABSC23_00035 [Bryobacteraceae bacterium]|jgi:hypothetical protein